eukprot:8564841-Pyramimonas_sp.AAC.1
MAVADTFWRSGATFFQGMHRSKIDHVIMPQMALARVKRLNTLQSLGRRLQKYVSTHLHDHVPVLLEMDVGSSRAHQAQFTPPANRDAMMTAYSNGYRRQGFLEK